jgi:Family of unknown function (DUF6348)
MNPNDWLSGLMNAHGVRSEQHDEWIVFPDHGKRGYARLFPREHSCQLDIGIEIYPGWLVLESFAGIGADIDAALKDAFDAFARGALHVMLSAFFRATPDEQVTREQWNIARTTRQMTLGNVVFRGRTPADPVHWFPQLETALKSLALPEGTHWLRLYYAQRDSQAMIHEALLDNETWPELQEAMARFSWPLMGDFYSARLFLVIQGGVGLAEACTAICRAGGHDAIDEMVTMGATLRQATLLYSFLTLAFGRKIIERLGASTSADFLLCSRDGQQTGRALANEPLFLQATALAQSRSQLSKDQFNSIAAEF